LVCDASSDFISRPIDVSKYGLIYAGAQKNAGPAGVALVIARQDLVEKTPDSLPAILNYKTHAADGSLYNTPPCFTIYIVGLVLKWAKELGGLEAVAKRNRAKAEMVYKAIDESGGFYKGHAKPENRSLMNITYRLPSEVLEEQFTSEAKKQDLIGLKGHRSVGGIRATMYNAMPIEGAESLSKFMKEFQQKNG
jgi:phosphoserine aminotransferase